MRENAENTGLTFKFDVSRYSFVLHIHTLSLSSLLLPFVSSLSLPDILFFFLACYHPLSDVFTSSSTSPFLMILSLSPSLFSDAFSLPITPIYFAFYSFHWYSCFPSSLFCHIFLYIFMVSSLVLLIKLFAFLPVTPAFFFCHSVSRFIFPCPLQLLLTLFFTPSVHHH